MLHGLVAQLDSQDQAIVNEHRSEMNTLLQEVIDIEGDEGKCAVMGVLIASLDKGVELLEKLG